MCFSALGKEWHRELKHGLPLATGLLWLVAKGLIQKQAKHSLHYWKSTVCSVLGLMSSLLW
jgi:hypothetical protein